MWSECARFAGWIRNRVKHEALEGKAQIEVLGSGWSKELEFIPCAFAKTAWAHFPEEARPRGKLAARSRVGVFV